MNEPARKRSRAMRGLAAYLERRGYPRVALAFVLVLTGLAGFGISFCLLHGGMGAMWMRYPLATLGAYGIFLLLMRIWVEITRLHVRPEDPEVLAALEEGGPDPVRSTKGWLDALDFSGWDVPDVGIDAEGCLPAILIAVVVGLLGLVVLILFGAPVLLAEVLIDIFLAGVLYRRLKNAADENWLGTCIRKTWGFVLATAFLLLVGGLALEAAAPGSKSIGPALKEIFR